MNFKAEHVMKTMFLGFTKSGTEYYIVLQESENEDGNIMNKKSKNSAILDLSGSCLVLRVSELWSNLMVLFLSRLISL